jgi:hypothetical protein
MSELSTVAIKDGHRGHFPHHHLPQDAERADRISRLTGLERFATARQASAGNVNPGAAGYSNPPPGYFDANNQPQIFRERSTVGSASATGSVGGRTTWASGSDVYDADRMSEDQDNETSSMGGFSDEAASLVGFGEGARTPARQQSAGGHWSAGTVTSPGLGKATAAPPYLSSDKLPASPMTGVSSTASVASTNVTEPASSADTPRHDVRHLDGMTYDPDVVDTVTRTPPIVRPDSGRGMENVPASETEKEDR